MLRQKFILQFATGIIAQLITAATGILVARWAGPETIGTVAYGAAYVSIFGFGLGLFASSHMKLVSEGQDHGNCVRTFTTLQSLNILLFSLIFIAWLLFQLFVREHAFQKEQLLVILLYFVFFVLSQFLNMWQINFTATIEVAKNSIPILLQNIFYNITRITVVLLGFGAVALTGANFTGLLIAMPITLFYMKKLPSGSFDKILAKKYLSFSSAFLIILICGTLIQYIGRILLERFEDLKELGLFTAGYSIAAMLLLISSSSGTIFFPLFSKLVSENKIDKIKNQIITFERVILLFLAPPVFLVSLYASPIIIFLLGDQYILSGEILSILIITSFIQIVAIPHGNLLAGMGLFRLTAILNILQLLIFLISILFFLDHRLLGLGAVGLAWSVMIANFFLSFCFMIMSASKGKVITFKSNILYYVSGIILYTVIRIILTHFLHEKSFLIQITISIIIVALYYGILYLNNMLKREDIKLISDLINPNKMIRYIKSDI